MLRHLGLSRSGEWGIFALAVAFSALPAAAFQNPAGGVLSTGETIEIIIDSPADGSALLRGAPLNLLGRTNIPEIPVSDQFNILYVVDVSGSTGFTRGQDCDGDGLAGDADDDYNFDGTVGDTLDCEISGVLALNNQLSGQSSFEGGLIPFGTSAAIADVSPEGGSQAFTSSLLADLDGNGIPDLEQVARSLDQGRVGLFQALSVGTSTNFNRALEAMQAAFGQQDPTENNIAFFLSDGVGSLSTGPGTPLDAVARAGTRVNTYSVGAGGAGCGSSSGLRVIADATGGSCFVVTDPSRLAITLVGTAPRGIDHVEVVVNDSPPITDTVFVDALGNWGAFVPADLVSGDSLRVEVTVVATDGTRVTACVTYPVFDRTGDEDLDGLDDGFEQTLIASFAPIVHLHPNDKFRPSSVDWYLDRVEMGFRHFNLRAETCEHPVLGLGEGLDASGLISQTHPELPSAACAPHDERDPITSSAGTTMAPEFGDFFLDIPGNDPRTRNGSPENERDWACYAHAFPAPDGKINIQYWFFYPFNGLQRAGFGLHEGDWEHVTVRVDEMGNTIERIYYAAHDGEGRWFLPQELSTVGDQPVVFSATDSHASYPRAGQQDRSDLPDDHTAVNDRPWNCQDLVINVGECANPLPGGEWVRYNGRWGGTRNGIRGHSPQGPGFQASWCGDNDKAHPDERVQKLCRCP